MSTILNQISNRKGMMSVDEIFNSEYHQKTTQYKEDPLALACAVKRQDTETPGVYFRLDSERLSVTDEDTELSEKIRSYYSKKWFWQVLKDASRMSDFRRRACHLLESRIHDCSEQDSGIYFKLPWFYQEDMIYDDFKKTYNTIDIPTIVYGSRAVKSEFELTYLKSSVCKQQKRKLERFWFTNGTYLYNIEITQDNPLIEMFRNMIEPGKSVCFTGYYKIERLDQMYFYSLFQFNFSKEQNA